jgi:hypothetical protein
MKMCSSGFAPRRRQGGFIQGAILFALVIIAVVVAAFSLANRDSQSSADSEQARVNASFVLKVGNDLQTGVNRAIADGFPAKDLATKMVFITAEEGELNLFDSTLKYLIRPQFPTTALQDPEAQPFDEAAPEVTFSTAAVDGAGSDDLETIIEVANLKEDVCKRINVTTNGKLVTDAPDGTVAAAAALGKREGCAGSGSAFSYFRVVATDTEADG